MFAIVLFVSVSLMTIIGKPGFDYGDESYMFLMGGRNYDLHKPAQRWDLPNELQEVSGLSFFRKNQLACIQDEDGVLYFFSTKNGEITRREQFGEKGDYEGVEILGNEAFVLKSNGKVYHFSFNNQSIGEVQQIKTHLSRKNDAEGLGFGTEMNELLIACKEDPGTDRFDEKKGRSIYKIDVAEQDFKKKPRFSIKGKAFNEMLSQKGLSRKKHKPFKPSGVAVHPTTGNVFVIASVGKMLAILNKQGELVDLIPLDPKLFRQPEGICFAPNGDLFIASEGRGDKGYILRF
jgi:uncharacterized protein YjiK